MKNKIIIIIDLLITLGACNIEEQIYDEALGENLVGNASDENLIAPVYASLRAFYGHRFYFALQCYTSDEAMLPTRINDWYDGGTFQELQLHSWTPDHSYVKRTWNELMGGIARSLQAIEFLDDGSSTEAEAIALLSFNMMAALDLYGQVPYRDINNIDFNTDPEILQGQEAIDMIIANLNVALPNLPNGPSTVRFTKDAAKSLLARLYLNKAVYTDRYASSFNFDNADMQKVIDYTTEVINSGKYQLETDDYFTMFDPDNENHKEIIFSVKNEVTMSVLPSGNGISYTTTNSMSRGLFLTPSTKGSDAGCTLPEFLATWDTSDPRFYKENYPNQEGFVAPEDYKLNRGFLVGQQYGAKRAADGSFVTDENGNIEIVAIRSTRDQSLANHTPEVKLVATSHSSGVRITKWDVDLSVDNKRYSGVDIPIFRLADLYLMRAEAKLRAGNGDALVDINAVREARKSGFGLSSATLQDVLNERGYEFYWEFHRRTDQIRFGKWEDSWTEKSSSDVNKRLFPIPPESITVTPGLDQNSGY